MEQNNNPDLNKLIEMIGAMASLDFTRRMDTKISDDPLHVIAYGLNMLSEELEAHMVKKSLLKEVNSSLERFSYTVAHDIRSPLNSAIALVDIIETEVQQKNYDNLEEYLSMLRQIHKRTGDMVSGILEYSRANFNNIQAEPVDTKNVCAEIVSEYALNSNVTLSYSNDLPTVYYNEMVLKQILSNLVSNAIKHNDKDHCTIHIGYASRDTFHELSVKDNGPGIKNEDISRAFNLFENLDTTKEDSYGIGLSIVKKLVNQANGNVWVESAAGSGATFVFTINKTHSEMEQ